MPSKKTSAPALEPCPWRPPGSTSQGPGRKRGSSLDDIAEETKISLRFLRAICKKRNSRSCRAASLAQVICGNYATAIGYDETELLAHYDRKMNPPAAG